jgi:hypothetical protein
VCGRDDQRSLALVNIATFRFLGYDRFLPRNNRRSIPFKSVPVEKSPLSYPFFLLCLDIAADQQVIEAADAIPAVPVGFKHDPMLPVCVSLTMIF